MVGVMRVGHPFYYWRNRDGEAAKYNIKDALTTLRHHLKSGFLIVP